MRKDNIKNMNNSDRDTITGMINPLWSLLGLIEL